MSVQRFSAYHSGDPSRIGLWADTEGHWVTYADHARIVAEAGAAVFAFHPEWTVTGMCDPDCLACRRLTELIAEREKGYEEGKADAAAPRILTADDRLDYDEDGEVDESVVRNADMVHLERLDGGVYYCAVYVGPLRIMFNLHGPVTVGDNDLIHDGGAE